MEFTAEGLAGTGFGGFVPFVALEESMPGLLTQGVYAVLRPPQEGVRLNKASSGFWHQGKDPAYSLANLQPRWELPTPVLYLGKAGGISGGTTLWGRLSLYRRYGAGEDVTHRGGRAIWQVEEAVTRLVVCWAPTPGFDPECVESGLLQLFKTEYGALPMANQRQGRKCPHDPPCSWPGAFV